MARVSESKTTTGGKNIRVSLEAWELIRKYCASKDIKMGRWVENVVLSKIPISFKNADSKTEK